MNRIDTADFDKYPSALCRQSDPELFYPDKGDAMSSVAAKKICAVCPHLTECRQDAIDRHEPFGIWGGLSADDRRDVAKGRKTVAA